MSERFTELPTTTAAQLTDIICCVQGYVSPSVLGTSVQETLGQILTLFKASGAGSIIWNQVLTPTLALTTNNGYYVNDASGLVTLTLPAVSSFGDVIYIMGHSSGGWRIAQTTGQQIVVGDASTTIGSGCGKN